MSQDLEIKVIVQHHTDRAILVDVGRTDAVWIPRSQISDFSGPDLEHADSIFISQWLATQKGIL